MSTYEITKEQTDELLHDIDARKAARAAKMPDTEAALRQMFEAWLRLKELGWNQAMYCPKDGSEFAAIEAGSTGVFDCHYSGKWPTGSWWISDGGDLWPSSPILWRPLNASDADPASTTPSRETT